MTCLLRKSIRKDLVRGLLWGSLLADGSPLRLLTQGEQLTQEDIARLKTALELLPPLVSEAPLPDILGTGTYVVSAKVIDIIASVQPGLHKQIPVVLVGADGETIADSYYFLHIPVHLDCIDLNRTHWSRGSGEEGARESRYTPRIDFGMVLKAKAIEGFHIWRGAPPAERHLFISDHLRALFLEHSVTGWDYLNCDEI